MITTKFFAMRMMQTTSFSMLAPVSTYNFASRYKMNRITTQMQRITLPDPETLNLVLPSDDVKPKKAPYIKVHVNTRRASFKKQPTPIHDFINFKRMTGNEILLNLENHNYLAITELLGALHELSKKTPPKHVDWMSHPTTASAMLHLKSKIDCMTAKQLCQVPILLHRFTWMDKEMWQSCEKNILRMLHKYNSRDMA